MDFNTRYLRRFGTTISAAPASGEPLPQKVLCENSPNEHQQANEADDPSSRPGLKKEVVRIANLFAPLICFMLQIDLTKISRTCTREW
jgi:hypothetical protein